VGEGARGEAEVEGGREGGKRGSAHGRVPPRAGEGGEGCKDARERVREVGGVGDRV
jgi:hypothetical protein